MKRLAWTVSLAALLLAAAGALARAPLRAQELTTEQITAKTLPAIVCIFKFNESGNWTAQGTGFFIAPGRLLTDAHVITGAYSLEVVSDGRVANIKHYDHRSGISILKVDKKLDLALIGLSPDNPESLTLEDKDLSFRIGQPVVAFGNPARCLTLASTGIIRGVDDRRTPSELIISAPGGHGSSGGPVCNLRGNVVGIWRAKRNAPLYGLATDVKEITKFLKTPDHPRPLPAAGAIVPRKPNMWKAVWSGFRRVVGAVAGWLWHAAGFFVRLVGLVGIVGVFGLGLVVLAMAVMALIRAYRRPVLPAVLMGLCVIAVVVLWRSPRLSNRLFPKDWQFLVPFAFPFLAAYFFLATRKRIRRERAARARPPQARAQR